MKRIYSKFKWLLGHFKIVILLLSMIFFVAVNCIAFVLENFTVNLIVLFVNGIIATSLLWLLIIYVRDKAEIKLDKVDYLSILIMVALSFVLFYYIVSYRNTIYVWDNALFYNNTKELISEFKFSNMRGLYYWFYSGQVNDYGSFLCLFIYPVFVWTNQTVQMFILSYYFTCVVPAMIMSYFFAMYIKKEYFSNSCFWIKPCIALSISLFPLLHSAAINGTPDVFGLVFCFAIIILTHHFDFIRLDISFYIILPLVSIALVLTRRYYLYFIIPYYFLYFIIRIVNTIVFKKGNERKVKIINMIVFIITSAVVSVLLLRNMIFRVIGNNYSELYNSWNKGGFFYELFNQVNYVGLFVSILIVIGFFIAIKNEKIRLFSIVLLCSNVLSILLFTRVQNLNDHHSLILFPLYWFGYLNVVYYLVGKRQILRFIPSVILLFSIVNCVCFNFENNVSDFLFSTLDLYPNRRIDLKQIKEVVSFLDENVSDKDTVMVLSGSEEYDCMTFKNYPEINANEYIQQNNYFAASGGFPTDFFDSRYVVLLSPIQGREQVIKERVLQGIIDVFIGNEYVSDKFELRYNEQLQKEIDVRIYERTKQADRKEIEIFESEFSDYCKKYPQQFYERLETYKLY